LTVDSHDNDPAVLLTYLAVALDRVASIEPETFKILASPSTHVPPAVVPRLAAAMSATTEPVALVLDHVELLDNRQCLDALAQLALHLGGTDAPLEALAERLGDDRWLLVLDNLEQVLEVAGDLEELLARCRGVTVLATSRMVLGLRAEQEYPVLPLLLPADPTTMTVAQLAASPAVALFAVVAGDRGHLRRRLDHRGGRRCRQHR
jgi:predicted ATPase